MNPDDQKPVTGAAPTSADPNMTPPAVDPAMPAQAPQAPVGPTPPLDDQPAAPSFGQEPAAGPTAPVDNTPGVSPVSPNPAESAGAYGQGTMQPESPQPLTPSTTNKPIDRRKTGLILLAVVIVALAVVAWLMTQAFSS